MRKPTWITLVGWFAVACLLFAITASLMARGRMSAPIPAAVAALAMLVAVPSLGLWLLASLVHRVTVHGARVRAQAMVEAQTRASAPICAQCRKRIPTVACLNHGVQLCATCWADHQKSGCQYRALPVPPLTPVAMVR